ncbi:MAG TPA: hypothetical protein VF691_22380 [Cytophagaceae bacterium]|jgi:hypothetical protein
MTEALQFIKKYSKRNSHLKSGSLCFFGVWFGKPLENYHTIKEINYLEIEDCIAITFDEGEILSIWNPRGLICDKDQFKIEKASWMRWVWYPYGSKKTPDNLMFAEFFFENGKIKGRSNANCFDFSTIQGPALQIF